MAKTDPSKDPSTTSSAWDCMAPKWGMLETLLGGTESMRAAGGLYLPRHAEESGENYGERLNRTTLFNMLELTLDALVGKPFSDPMRLNDDVPAQIKAFEDDIDLQGNDVTTFSRHWFREGLSKGFAHVLVDSPAFTPAEQATRTLADDVRDGVRPYWCFVRPENVIFATSEVVGGREMLTHVRIRQEIVERVGFAETCRQQIKVLEPGRWETWEYVVAKGKTKGSWQRVDEGTTTLDFIPLVTFYADRKDLMLAKPPLEDLAHLNVRHWQSTSDQINVLTVARFPMLAVAGATDHTGSSMAIGPKQLLGTRDPNGRFYYVEHTGRAIEAGRQDLMDLEQMMASYGAEFLKRRPGNVTATASALDSAESMSSLQDMVNRFRNSVNVALGYTARMLKLPSGGSVTIKNDFTASQATSDNLKTLVAARKAGDISRDDFLQQLKDMGVLNDDFDPRVNMVRLMVEVSAAGGSAGDVNPADFQVAQGQGGAGGA